MTTQTLFSNEKRKNLNRRFFNLSYFKFIMKTGWPLLVVFIFLFILSMGVATVSFLTTEMNSYYGDYKNYNTLREHGVEFLYMMGTFNVVISMFCGLLCGITTMKYTNSKVGVNFYHSLPIRREALFLTSSLRSFTYYVTSFAAGLLLMFAIIAVRLGTVNTVGMFVRPVLLTFEYGVLFFFLVYAMTLFAASLTGTGFMRFVGALYVIFLPLVMFVLFIAAVGNCGIYNTILDVDYYMSGDFLMNLCSPLRLINLCDTGRYGEIIFKGAFTRDVVIVFVTAIVFYGLAFLLYCIRASESASKPVIWRPAAFVFKYASMFIGGTVFALIFNGMFESVPWMIFGIILGSVIVFMVTNGILNKSARSIFKGLRGFGIYMGAMAMVTVLFYCDVFGIFANVPSGSLVNRVELYIDYSVSAEYGGDFASKVTGLIEDALSENPLYEETEYIDDNSNGYVGGADESAVQVYTDIEGEEDDKFTGYAYGYSSANYESNTIEAVFHTKFGIPYAISVYPLCEGAYDLVRFVYDSGKIKEALPAAEEIEDGYVDMFLDNNYDYGYDYDSIKSSTELEKFCKMLSDPMGIKADSVIVGKISINTIDSDYNDYRYNNYRSYFITAKDVEAINKICVLTLKTEDDVVDYFIKKNKIKALTVVDNSTNKRMDVRDADLIHDVVKSMSSINGYETPVLCSKEHRYGIFLWYEEDQYANCVSFRKGCVPESVAEFFGE